MVDRSRNASRAGDRSGSSALTQDSEALAILRELRVSAEHLARDYELEGILRALDGRFVRPAPGGDLLRTAAVLPTGRNLHGFDPFRIPSVFALRDGRVRRGVCWRATWRIEIRRPKPSLSCCGAPTI